MRQNFLKIPPPNCPPPPTEMKVPPPFRNPPVPLLTEKHETRLDESQYDEPGLPSDTHQCAGIGTLSAARDLSERLPYSIGNYEISTSQQWILVMKFVVALVLLVLRTACDVMCCVSYQHSVLDVETYKPFTKGGTIRSTTSSNMRNPRVIASESRSIVEEQLRNSLWDDETRRMLVQNPETGSFYVPTSSGNSNFLFFVLIYKKV
ncbi:unnamed protein product [Dracunculus medinensis]|uniref:Transmembrane protein n=1 Tax=Dracunculus medinensis TaxID=318479 RepID=A0A0N4U2D1_DRAME|nr:unnamed protein product [Dracunculus medinensis]